MSLVRAVTSQQERPRFDSWVRPRALPFCMGSPHSPKACMFKYFADSKLSLGVIFRVKVVSVRPVMEWRPVQGVFPCFQQYVLPPATPLMCKAGTIMDRCTLVCLPSQSRCEAGVFSKAQVTAAQRLLFLLPLLHQLISPSLLYAFPCLLQY